jgi:putative Holliday junction resolvase
VTVVGGILALDVGEARIGTAVTPPGSSFAFGRKTIKRRHLTADVQEVYDLANREGATLIVVGLPIRTDGTDSDQAKRVRSFAKALGNKGLDITFEDERYTTKLASHHISKGNYTKRIQRDKGLIDQVSAILILETYLERTQP